MQILPLHVILFPLLFLSFEVGYGLGQYLHSVELLYDINDRNDINLGATLWSYESFMSFLFVKRRDTNP